MQCKDIHAFLDKHWFPICAVLWVISMILMLIAIHRLTP